MALALFRGAICSTLLVEFWGQSFHPGRVPLPRPRRQAGIPTEDASQPSTPPISSSPNAIAMLGEVGRIVVNGTGLRTGKQFVAGDSIYGSFSNGFSTLQQHALQLLGCTQPSRGYVDGGVDLSTTEQMIAFQCGITLPRIEDGNYISLLDECGATDVHHFHKGPSCLYDDSSGGHSAQVGEVHNGKLLYGKWEHAANRMLPQLDACGAHYGFTPDSPSQAVYHYHVQDRPPFTIGCFGPNDDASLVTVAECRSFYAGCDADFVNITSSAGIQPYDKWCPCFDANGVNTALNFAELSVFTTTTTTAGGQQGWALYRFVPLKLRSDSTSVQIAEITFRYRGTAVSFHSATAFADRGDAPLGYEPARAIDGLSHTKWVDFGLTPLSIKFPEATPIDSYTLITADDALDRDPVQWRLEGSNDGGIAYDVLHEVLNDYETPTDRQLMLEWFRIPRCLMVTADGGQQACLSTSELVPQRLAATATPT